MSKQLKRIVTMANALLAKRKEVEQLTEQLRIAKEQQAQIELVDLPELMREVELKSFQLADGSAVILEEDFHCGITKANHGKAMAWLDDHGFGGLIKTQIKIEFNREDYAEAVKFDGKLQEELEQAHLVADHTLIENIHAGTLKAFIREQLKEGNHIPVDLFSIHPYPKVHIHPST